MGGSAIDRSRQGGMGSRDPFYVGVVVWGGVRYEDQHKPWSRRSSSTAFRTFFGPNTGRAFATGATTTT